MSTEPEISYRQRRREELMRWLRFIKERFDPLSHLVMMGLFIAAFMINVNFLELGALGTIQKALLCIFVFLFFLKLRFYDEIKDYETDLVINPTRPLPRGLLSLYQVKRAIEWTILFELVILMGLGGKALIMGIVAIAYSLLMYKEFFIPHKIRPLLTTYAMSHTFVTIFLSFTMMCALTQSWVWKLPSDLIKFSVMAWPLFNIFEFGRKTYQPSEEREGVPTYSNIWTKPGAFALVVAQAVFAAALMLSTKIGNTQVVQNSVVASVGLLCLIGMLYIISSSVIIGKIYRIYSSVYIILTYVSFLFYKL